MENITQKCGQNNSAFVKGHSNRSASSESQLKSIPANSYFTEIVSRASACVKKKIFNFDAFIPGIKIGHRYASNHSDTN